MAPSVRGPDFFLVGAAKCGTTAMDRFLAEHPEIYMPATKEPHRFGRDLELPRVSEDEYPALFEGAETARRVGEASVFYLYSKQAAQEIFNFNPEARILIMLRNPVDMIHSYHQERLWSGNEDLPDLGDALSAEADRRLGRRIPRLARFTQGLQYRQLGAFAEQVARYLEVFGRDRVHVVLHDDLVEDIGETYRGICRFLEVDSDFQPAFRSVNAAKVARSPRLTRAMKNPDGPLRKISRVVAPLRVRQYARQKLLKLNTRTAKRTSLTTELRNKLTTELRPDVLRLSTLLGRDLSHWLAEA